jgi:hypothetical protein
MLSINTHIYERLQFLLASGHFRLQNMVNEDGCLMGCSAV